MRHRVADRVAGGCHQPQAPQERCVIVSHHTAQASEKVSLVGVPTKLLLYILLHVTHLIFRITIGM